MQFQIDFFDQDQQIVVHEDIVDFVFDSGFVVFVNEDGESIVAISQEEVFSVKRIDTFDQHEENEYSDANFIADKIEESLKSVFGNSKVVRLT